MHKKDRVPLLSDGAGDTFVIGRNLLSRCSS